MTPTTKPLVRGIISLSLLSLSFACLITVLACPFLGVSTVCPCVTECFVFVSCFESDTAYACGSVRRGSERLNIDLVVG